MFILAILVKKWKDNVQLIREKLQKSLMLGLIVVFCVSAMAVILFGVKQFKIGSQLSSVNQVANLSHILVRQQANLFSVLLTNNAKSEQFTENLDNLAKENFVLDATIYDYNGKVLAQSSNTGNLREQLGLEHKNESEFSTQQIVEPIYSSSNNGIRGFLRVTFDAQYMQTTQGKINQVFHRLYGELIIIFLLGALFASSIHYFLSHYRRAYRKPIETTNVVKKSKSSSLRFHQRRRRI